MTSHERRTSIDRASVQSILSPKAESPAAADPPSPHIGVSPNRDQFSMPPPSRPQLGHARARSSISRRSNRLSLSFPIATGLAPYSNDSSRPTPTSTSSQSFPPTPVDSAHTSPNDPASYLVALAGQERKVLELKEELQKAEAELIKLKDQWKLRESYKKRAEIRAIQPLQLVQSTSTESTGNSIDVSKRNSMEIDKRKALLTKSLSVSTNDSRRKFSGAHTRTLSLLSPERANYKQPFSFPPVQETSENSPPKASSIPDTSQGITRINSNRNRHSYQSGVTHAKLIAEDVKAGLWTFLEDIRQATIGDEAAENAAAGKKNADPVKTAGKQPSRNSLRASARRRNQSPRGSPSPRPRDGERTIFDAVESSLVADKAKVKTKKSFQNRKTAKPISLAAPAIDDLDDGWSNWDSPMPKSPRWSGSTTASETPPTPSNGKKGVEHVVE